jgi:pyruvate,orthophosphate dikinase
LTGKEILTLRKEMPKSYSQLDNACKKLEKHRREPQDIEFTIEQGKFYLLQTRAAKMSAFALIKTSVDMVKEKLIDKNKALTRIPAQQLEALLHKTINQNKAKEYKQLTKGIAASPGAASGIAVFDVKKAISLGENNTKVILIRKETKPEDVPAFFSSEGILTSQGGKSSHAAIVSRGMGKPCIVGSTELKIDYDAKKCEANGTIVSEGDSITIDGSTGIVYIGDIPMVVPKVTKDFKTILSWAQKIKRLGIRANADTPDAAKLARKFGAEGIGLCRTERMFNLLSALNILSVLHKPIPSAPNFRASFAASGVSAFARIPRRFIFCAHDKIVLKSFVTLGTTIGISPMYTIPVLPSIVIESPSETIVPFASHFFAS